MDLNDPRRRLQVLNNSNPSLRVSVAPQVQPKISIAQPQAQPQQRIIVPQGPKPVQQAPAPQVPQTRFKAIKLGEGTNKTIFGWNAAALLPKQFEKKYTSTNVDQDFASEEEFLKYFDTRADDFRRQYVARMQKDSATDPVAAKTLRLLEQSGRFKGSFMDFVEGANERLYGGISRGGLRGADFLLPGKNTFGLEQLAEDQEQPRQFTKAGKTGETVGTVEKAIFDIAGLFAGGAAAEKAASKVPALTNLVNKLQNGGMVSRAAGRALGALPGSLGGSAADVLQTAGRGDEQNVAKSVGIGTALDLGLPVVGRLGKKGFNLFRGTGSKSVGFVSDLIQETNPQAIKRVLGEVDEGMAKYLAEETNPETVKAILQQMAVDPNIKLSDDVRKRLEEEGITAVRREDNPYGAAYNTEDASISVRGQADATDANLYHELGHHIYTGKLTPEEKALLAQAKGRASAEAAGRAGYTADDLVSEDFGDYMRLALSGRMAEVPENVREVVSKYAKVAAEEAQAAGIPMPATKSTDLKPTPKVQSQVDPELVNQGFITGKIDNAKLNDLKLGSDTVGDIDVNQVAKYLDDISNGKPIEPLIVQRGPNGELLVQDGKHRLEALKALGIEDVPVTEKVVKQADEVQQAVTDVEKAQTGVSDAPIAQADNVADNAVEGATDAAATVAPVVNKNADEAADRFSEFEPEVQANLKKIMDELPNAQSQYDEAGKLRTKEKGQRIGKAAGSYETAGGGEQGFRAKLGSLKGKYSESGFSPIEADEGVQKTILDDIEKSGLRDFEKLNTQNAMRKIWGANPEKPTTSDINYIRKYFGDELADTVQQAVEEGTEKTWRDNLAQIAGTPRALMATGDLSMGFRQAAPLGTRMPKEWARANKESVKYATSTKYFDDEMAKIRNSDEYETISDKMKVALTGADTSMEEAFAAADLAEKIPVGGHVVKASDRAYSGGLTRLRFDAAKKIIDSYGGTDQFLKFYEGNDDAMKALGEVINTFTGRGGKAGGLVEQHMKTLSTTLFAPRLWAAKLNSLNPAWYGRLFKANPKAAKLALQTQASFLTTAGVVLSLAAAAGAEVVWDPRSADFAKVKVGNTRYDILGGLQQNIRLGAQLATGEKINSATGELETLGDGFTAPSRYDIMLQAFENKENPLLSYATTLLKGKDFTGQPVNPATEALKRVTPLGAQAVVETAKDTGNIGKSIAMNVPGFFGIGVQTYGDVKSKDKGSDGKYAGPITPEMVLGNDGKPILDERGRPVKVNFPDDATELEKQAMLDDKRKAALNAQFRQGLSKEDQALMKLTKTQLKQYVKDGKIDQDRYDQIQQYQQDIENLDGVDLPEGVKSPLATSFYNKYNSMTKESQDKWLKEAPDATSKSIAKLLNKERSEGLSEFKPSNELAKAYAEFEKRINTNGYSAIEKRDQAKEFQKYAYKLNYSEDQRDVYTEGSSSDLRYMIDQGQIAKKDLDEAIKMDDELYNSGLSSTLKFSKKFRGEYGYGLPSGGGKNKNLAGSGSGGSGSKSTRSYIANLLPSFATSKQGGDKPEFSPKPRNLSFKVPGNIKKGGSSGKKISIKL